MGHGESTWFVQNFSSVLPFWKLPQSLGGMSRERGRMGNEGQQEMWLLVPRSGLEL